MRGEKGLEKRRDGTELGMIFPHALTVCISYLHHRDWQEGREEALVHGDRCEQAIRATMRGSVAPAER